MAARSLTMRLPIRWRDIDRLGHMNQSVYHELLEEARASLMLELPDDPAAAITDGWVVAHVDLDYHTEVRKDHEAVDVTAAVERIGNSSVTLRQEVRLLDGTLAASGHTVLVAWDAQARGKRTVSAAERAAFAGD